MKTSFISYLEHGLSDQQKRFSDPILAKRLFKGESGWGGLERKPQIKIPWST